MVASLIKAEEISPWMMRSKKRGRRERGSSEKSKNYKVSLKESRLEKKSWSGKWIVYAKEFPWANAQVLEPSGVAVFPRKQSCKVRGPLVVIPKAQSLAGECLLQKFIGTDLWKQCTRVTPTALLMPMVAFYGAKSAKQVDTTF
jgi:hypothetical protein